MKHNLFTVHTIFKLVPNWTQIIHMDLDKDSTEAKN